MVKRPDTRLYAVDPPLDDAVHQRLTAGDDSPAAAAAALLPPSPPSARAHRTSRRQQQQELLWGSPPAADARQHQTLDGPALAPPLPPATRGPSDGVGAPEGAVAIGSASDPVGEGHLGPADLQAQRDAALLMRGGRHRTRRPVAEPQAQEQLPSGAAPTSTTRARPLPLGDDGAACGDDTGAACGDDTGTARARRRGGSQEQYGSDGDGAGGGLKRLSDYSEARQQRKPRGRRRAPEEARGDPQPGDTDGHRGRAAAADAADAGSKPDGNDASAGGSGGGGGGGDGAQRGHVVLRLRRRGPEAQVPRRIRLPLPQRPKPWPVKVLLEAQQQQREQQLQGQVQGPGQGQGAQVEEREELQRLLGPEVEEVDGDGVGFPAVLPPPRQASVQARGAGQPAQQQQEQGGSRGLGTAAWGAHGAEAGGGGLGREGPKSPEEAALGEEARQRRGNKGRQQRQELQLGQQAQQAQVSRTAQTRVQVVAQAPAQQQNQQDRTGQTQAQMRREAYGKQQQQQQQQQEAERDLPASGAKGLAHQALDLPSPGSSGAQGRRRRPPQLPPERAVAAHPDGTLWSYRSRDLGPLATRVLQQLQPQPQEPREAVDSDGSRREATSARQQRDGGSVAARSTRTDSSGGDGCEVSPDGSGNSGSGGADVDVGGGACHVLVAGPYQAYNALRALSYVQGALRLVSYNRLPYAGEGEPGPGREAAAWTPALCFAASDVSVQDLRSYYEQTILYGTGPRPELGPPPQQLPPSQRAPSPPLPPALPAMRGWPEDESHLEPRALVSVFLTQPPPEFVYGAAAGAVRDAQPPTAVTAYTDVEALARVLVARLRRHGAARVQALGRDAAARALGVFSGACQTLSRSGLGAVAFPHMAALGTQPRAEVRLPAAAAAKAAAAARSAAGKRPSASSSLATAAAAALDPVLLDKAPQLVLHVVLCEWDEGGRPVACGATRPAAAAAAATGAAAGGAASAENAAGPVSGLTGSGILSEADAPPESTASTAASGVLSDAAEPPQEPTLSVSGGSAGSAGVGGDRGGGGAIAAAAASRHGVRLSVAVAASAAGGCERLRLGGPEGGGPDTRSTAAAVARCLAEGRPVALSAVGLGALLRLPVVLFRAQGELAKRELSLRRALVFTLRSAAAGGADGGAGDTSSLRSQERRKPQPRHRSQPAGPPAPADEAEAAEGDSLVAEVFWLPVAALQFHLDALPGPPPGIIAARAASRRLSLPAATHDDDGDGQRHRNYHDGSGGSDDNGGGEYDEGSEDHDDGGGAGDDDGGSGGGGNQRYVQSAAAAALEQLARYGTATLAGSSPGRRLTALLAAACVSEGLMRSAGLTVLVRVDGRVRPPATISVQQQQKQQKQQKQQPMQGQRESSDEADEEPAPVRVRPQPPRVYQLLLARIDPQVGRLQLLRPDDLMRP